jgi:large conductance mechanosensitive channel
MLKEFKNFILKGNMVDIAIGVIIAGAFGAVVASLTKNLISPIIGILGKQDFSNWFIVLRDGPHTKEAIYSTLAAAQEDGAVTLNYGAFIGDIFNFLILGVVVFALVKMYKRVAEKPTPEEAPATPTLTADQVLLTEIRDLLAKR